MKFGLLPGNIVKRANARPAGVVVVKFPLRNRPVSPNAAGNVDHPRRTKVRPGELLFARPDELHRFARGPSEARGFNRRFACVLAAVTGTGVRDDYANAFFGDAEGLGQFAPHPERPLSAR